MTFQYDNTALNGSVLPSFKIIPDLKQIYKLVITSSKSNWLWTTKKLSLLKTS